MGIRVDPAGAICIHEVAGYVDDVVAAISVAAKVLVEGVHVGVELGVCVLLVLHEGLAVIEKHLHSLIERAASLGDHLGELQVALGDGVAKDIHLAAVVVDIVLALHAAAGVLHHAAERIAKGGPAAVANVERPHGVGRDKLSTWTFSPAPMLSGVSWGWFRAPCGRPRC